MSPEKLREIYQQVVPLNFDYLSKTQQAKCVLGRLRESYWKAGYVFSYQTQYHNYVSRTKWKMACTAGQTSVVIDYDGDVRVCELRRPIGNLRKYGMDFQRFWNSIERKLEVRQVALDQCFCTHICFMYDSMRHSKRVMLWELPTLLLKRFFGVLLDRSHRTVKPQPVQLQVAIPVRQS